MSNRAENANSLRYGRVHRLRHLRLRPPLRKHLRGKKRRPEEAQDASPQTCHMVYLE